ncbi:MAG: Sensory transduction histidine kinase [Clostridium butyricum DORA_1]|nr:MAG: Sensory transduction histidine kinase [Clostridium butyricum DORA_1]MDU1507197.1 ATP-binding protein [Clostridium butyricum]MDU4799676.1 ATP-binding protein [Clostridium butyricum]
MKKVSEKFERNYTIEDLEQLLDSIPYELYLKDFEGRYKYANKSSMDRAGVNRDGIIGKVDSEFRTEEMAKICIDGDKRVLERGKETFIEDKIIYDNFETSYEVFKTIVHNNETRESMIGGISKFSVNNKSISKYMTNTCDSITNNIIDLNSQSVIKEVLIKLREIIQAKDISLYDYDYKAQEMIFVENFGYNQKVVVKQKYMVDNNYYENTSGIIHEVLSNNMFKDIYMLKNNNKLLGCIEIYYTMKPDSINEEFISYVCMVLSYIQSNKIFTDNLREEIKNRKEAYDKLEMVIEKSIKQNSYRLLKLANNMIDITKIDGGFYEINIINCDIIEIIEDIVQSLAEYIQDNKRNIIFDTEEEEVIIACDPNQIERIVLNILSNAMKFTSNGGNIYVDIGISDDCSKVIIRIGNDGEKLKQEDSVVIFDRFTQTDDFMTRKSEGSGIGLSLVKSLVEMHKGSIYVNTEISKGTEFCIELPIRKIMNNKTNYSMKKSLNSKVEKFDIEFSDIYS